MLLPTQGASSFGVVYDVDGLLRIAPLSRQLSRLGRLRRHTPGHEQNQRTARRHRWLIDPAYRLFLDSDGRPLGMRTRRTY